MVAFGEAPAARVSEQRVVAVARRRQPEQSLQHAVNMRRREEILAAGDQGYALERVIDRYREVVAARRVFTGQHDIAERPRVGAKAVRFTAAFLDPIKRAGQRQRAGKIEPQGVILPAALFCLAFLQAEQRTEEERAYSARHSIPDAVLAETALVDFLEG